MKQKALIIGLVTLSAFGLLFLASNEIKITCFVRPILIVRLSSNLLFVKRDVRILIASSFKGKIIGGLKANRINLIQVIVCPVEVLPCRLSKTQKVKA